MLTTKTEAFENDDGDDVLFGISSFSTVLVWTEKTLRKRYEYASVDAKLIIYCVFCMYEKRIILIEIRVNVALQKP